jgi:cytochrome P450
LPTLDPPAHTDLRRRPRESFAPRAPRLRELRVRELAAAVCELPEGVDIDMIPTGKRMGARVVFALIGAPKEDWVELQAWSNTLHEILPTPLEHAPSTQP